MCGMRVAVLAPPAWRYPPRNYGAWESVAGNLADGLAAIGVDVTLFASADSRTDAALHAVVPRPYAEDTTLDPRVWDALHISEVMERAAQFDIIHNHFDLMPLTYSRLIPTPLVTTIHGFSLAQYRLAYRKYRDSYFVSISDADRDPYLPYIATVYNGIDLNAFTFVPDPGEYLVFVGRIHPDKGVDRAIEIARRSGRRLVIAGIVQDQEYFDASIRPHLSADIEFIGPVGPEERDRLLGGAWATLHMTTIPERFGLAMVESMACGTPVIGTRLGSVPEVVANGTTGFVVSDVAEAVLACKRVGEIRRAACRARVEGLFTRERMTQEYLRVYERILSRHCG